MRATFNEKQKKFLEKAWLKNEEITIEGVNEVGEKFITTGRVSTIDAGQKMGLVENVRHDGGYGAIEDDYLFVEFGVASSAAIRRRSRWVAPYHLNACQEKYPCGLIIKTIKDSEGNVIFNNPNFKKIEKICLWNKHNFEEKNANRKIVKSDPITDACRQLIGKPIIYYDGENHGQQSCGVVASVSCVNNYGRPIIEILDGKSKSNIYPFWNSIVFEPKTNGEIKAMANTYCKKEFYIRRFIQNIPYKEVKEDQYKRYVNYYFKNYTDVKPFDVEDEENE